MKTGLEANRMHEIKDRIGVRTISGGGLELVSEAAGMCCKGGILTRYCTDRISS